MKRMTYVDKEGNQVNLSFERRKPLLRLFLIFNIGVPIIILSLIIFAVIQNKGCINVYDAMKKASLVYLKDIGEVPNVEGESYTINIGDLYSEQYLKSINTNDTLCSGTVKVTKYKKEFVYTIDTKNCGSCSVDKKYSDWSGYLDFYPRDNAIVDVTPFYNYYDREVNVTEWSEYYEDKEISDEVSKYGISLPLDDEKLKEIPKEGKIVTIESDTTYYYRYRDRSWKWYDIDGNYSGFSSERPEGFANKDEDTEKYTEWSEYSQNYPQEKDYRDIVSVTGYKYYYVNKQGKKVYYNKGKYTPNEEVNTEKYDQTEDDSTTMYRYRDKVWRWYNGQQSRYSSYSTTGSERYPKKDVETEILSDPSSWSLEKSNSEDKEGYRVEEKKPMTRFRTRYEILSMKAFNKPLDKKAFEKKVRMSVLEFDAREDVKLDVSYKFKYRKS